MQPKAREGLSRNGFGLRDLIFVMRKNQIDSARVNVDGFAQVLERHRRTFDMPARTSRTNGSLPRHLAVLRSLPQREIPRVRLFIFIDIDARARQISAEIVMRKFAVPGE